MPFSDDDLKRLKEWAHVCGCTSYEGKKPCRHEETNALLARLEAAEKMINANPDSRSYDLAYNEWRKAAGKDK